MSHLMARLGLTPRRVVRSTLEIKVAILSHIIFHRDLAYLVFSIQQDLNRIHFPHPQVAPRATTSQSAVRGKPSQQQLGLAERKPTTSHGSSRSEVPRSGNRRAQATECMHALAPACAYKPMLRNMTLTRQPAGAGAGLLSHMSA